MYKKCAKFKLKYIALCVAASFLPALSFAAAKSSTPQSDDFESYLKTPASCTAANCPTGAYFIQNQTDLNNLSGGLLAQNQDLLKTAHWTNKHYALMFAPNSYDTNSLPNRRTLLGFYTQIVGVGTRPDDVRITPGIEVYNNDCPTGNEPACLTTGALDNFWRGLENVELDNRGTTKMDSLRFAVSQASPVRRIHVTGTMVLCDWETPTHGCGWSSGGYMANSIVDGAFTPGSQQQWITRNTNLNGENQSTNWNMVLVGTQGRNPRSISQYPHQPDDNQWWNYPIIKQNLTPAISEKPYLIHTTGKWQMVVPNLKTDSERADFNDPSKIIDVNTSKFYVVAPERGTPSPEYAGVTDLNATAVQKINDELASGKNLIVMPGVYNLAATINVPEQTADPDKTRVIYGLGVPTMVCQSGICMKVDAEQGVKLAGILFEANNTKTLPPNNQALLQIGNPPKNSNDNKANPNILYDVYIRIAETQKTQRSGGEERRADTGIVIYTNNTIVDNTWIWRGDHDKASVTDPDDPAKNLVQWNQNTAKHGLVVYGDNTIYYGLAVEHFQDYQTMFYGNKAQVYFYQSEMPYDVTTPDLSAWTCTLPTATNKNADTHNGCASYWVSPDVTDHTAKGVGVYTYFAKALINPISGIRAPYGPNIKMNGIAGRWLNGISNSGMQSLIEDFSTPALTQGYGAVDMYETRVDAKSSVIGAYKDPVAQKKKKKKKD